MDIKNQIKSDNLIQLITFRLSGRLLGVDIIDVKEVCENISITPIHHASEKFCGYMNIRGQILLVVDLRNEFGFKQSLSSQQRKVVVFKDTVDEPFGILVDAVEDVVEIQEHQITDRRADESVAQDHEMSEKRKARTNLCSGVYPLDKEIVLLLNSRGILD